MQPRPQRRGCLRRGCLVSPVRHLANIYCGYDRISYFTRVPFVFTGIRSESNRVPFVFTRRSDSCGVVDQIDSVRDLTNVDKRGNISVIHGLSPVLTLY